MEKKTHLEVSKIINTHGVMGEIKLECRCDSPDILKNIPLFFIDGVKYTPQRVRVAAGGFVLMKLCEINDLDAAMKVKNKLLYARREDIKKEPGSHFICDLIGLDVIDHNTGKVYGKLSDVQKFTVQELYYIKTADKTVIMPNVPEFVKEIDEERGIFITPIKGFFDGDDSDEI